MATTTDYSELTVDELLAVEARVKRQRIMWAFVIGGFIGVVFWAVMQHASFFKVILLILFLAVWRAVGRKTKRILKLLNQSSVAETFGNTAGPGVRMKAVVGLGAYSQRLLCCVRSTQGCFRATDSRSQLRSFLLAGVRAINPLDRWAVSSGIALNSSLPAIGRRDQAFAGSAGSSAAG